MTRDPVCSVIVCTRERPAALQHCLAALRRLDHTSYELIVVDNTSGDERVERIAAENAAIYMAAQVPGLSRARNAGARRASGQIVAFIDDDAIARPGWLSGHAAALEDFSLAATTGRIIPPRPLTGSAGEWAVSSGADLGLEPRRLDRRSTDWFARANFGGIGQGGNMALRRDLFEAGWGFREDIGLPYRVLGEEHFAFFELIRAGWGVTYVPEAVVTHASASAGELRTHRRRVYRGSSAYLTMLAFEQPHFRRASFNYGVEAALGRRRGWRPSEGAGHLGRRLEKLSAAWFGFWTYVGRRLCGRVRPPSAEPPSGPLR